MCNYGSFKAVTRKEAGKAERHTTHLVAVCGEQILPRRLASSVEESNDTSMNAEASNG